MLYHSLGAKFGLYVYSNCVIVLASKASDSLAAFAILWFDESLMDMPPRVPLTVPLAFRVPLTMLSQ